MCSKLEVDARFKQSLLQTVFSSSLQIYELKSDVDPGLKCC